MGLSLLVLSFLLSLCCSLPKPGQLPSEPTRVHGTLDDDEEAPPCICLAGKPHEWPCGNYQ